jgi:hypothetical protein
MSAPGDVIDLGSDRADDPYNQLAWQWAEVIVERLLTCRDNAYCGLCSWHIDKLRETAWDCIGNAIHDAQTLNRESGRRGGGLYEPL